MKDPADESNPSDSKTGYEMEQLWSVHTMLHNCVRELLGESESDLHWRMTSISPAFVCSLNTLRRAGLRS